MKAKTIAPIQITTDNTAEFADYNGVYAKFGIKRSLLYKLHEQGLIKGVSLRRRGQTKGKRLWDIDSIRSYLKEQMQKET